MYLLTLVVNFIVAFYIMFVRYIYVLQKQNKISHFVSKPSVNNYMRGSNGGTADPDLRPSILN